MKLAKKKLEGLVKRARKLRDQSRALRDEILDREKKEAPEARELARLYRKLKAQE